MKIYVINLRHRSDRLEKMSNQLKQLGIVFDRIDAVNGINLSESDVDLVSEKGPLGYLALGDIGCFMSHRKAWQALIDSNESHGIILEDDVLIGKRFAEFINKINPNEIMSDIIKLDRHGNARHIVLLGKKKIVCAKETLRQLLSKHTGGGAYLISRECAINALTKSIPFNISVDHFLFNRNNSKFARKIEVLQIVPAVARQGLLANDGGDIHKGRLKQRTYDYQYWKREFIRGLYEFSQIPSIIHHIIFGARFQKISAIIDE